MDESNSTSEGSTSDMEMFVDDPQSEEPHQLDQNKDQSDDENTEEDGEASSAGSSEHAAYPSSSSQPSASASSAPVRRRSTRGTEHSRDIDTLNNPPAYIGSMRKTLFDINQPLELKPEEFDTYWPYVDNVWVRQHKSGRADLDGRRNALTSSHTTTDYYACRLQRRTYIPKESTAPRPEGKSTRKKKIREGGTCRARLKTVLHEGGAVRRVEICRIGEHGHTHDLDYIDKVKRNSVVMEIARSEVMKGYMPASVFSVMNSDTEKLIAIGGKFLKTNDIRNASLIWRKNHQGELKVHPGYRYDHGNRVLPSGPRPVQFADSAGNEAARSDDAGNNRQSLPKLSSSIRFPNDTLHFSPHLTPFFASYLAANDPPASPSATDAGSSSPSLLPHVTLTYATSLDSFLALSPTVPTPISGPMSKAMTHYLRSNHDAILVGVGTAIADDPTLNCRIAGAGGYGGLGWLLHPRPIIIDPGARWHLTPDSKILKAAKKGKGKAPWVVALPDAPVSPARIDMLKSFGGKYLALAELDPRYRLRWEAIFKALRQEGIRSIMVEGGGMVINELLGREENRKLIDSVIVTVSPQYLGEGGVKVAPPRTYDMNGTPVPVTKFEQVKWLPLGEDVVMLGRMPGSNSNKGGNNEPPLPPLADTTMTDLTSSTSANPIAATIAAFHQVQAASSVDPSSAAVERRRADERRVRATTDLQIQAEAQSQLQAQLQAHAHMLATGANTGGGMPSAGTASAPAAALPFAVPPDVLDAGGFAAPSQQQRGGRSAPPPGSAAARRQQQQQQQLQLQRQQQQGGAQFSTEVAEQGPSVTSAEPGSEGDGGQDGTPPSNRAGWGISGTLQKGLTPYVKRGR